TATRTELGLGGKVGGEGGGGGRGGGEEGRAGEGGEGKMEEGEEGKVEGEGKIEEGEEGKIEGEGEGEEGGEGGRRELRFENYGNSRASVTAKRVCMEGLSAENVSLAGSPLLSNISLLPLIFCCLTSSATYEH